MKGFDEWAVFGIYEKNKVMIAGEFNKLFPPISMALAGQITVLPRNRDQWYGMASYKVAAIVNRSCALFKGLGRLGPV